MQTPRYKGKLCYIAASWNTVGATVKDLKLIDDYVVVDPPDDGYRKFSSVAGGQDAKTSNARKVLFFFFFWILTFFDLLALQSWNFENNFAINFILKNYIYSKLQGDAEGKEQSLFKGFSLQHVLSRRLPIQRIPSLQSLFKGLKIRPY